MNTAEKSDALYYTTQIYSNALNFSGFKDNNSQPSLSRQNLRSKARSRGLTDFKIPKRNPPCGRINRLIKHSDQNKYI